MDPKLKEISHRPWPLPASRWVMAQSWHDLLFAHWPVEISALRRAVPSTLAIDAYQGQAWLGVVPFRMSGVRLRGTPAVPWLSSFPELNVRTYVVAEGKPGVWFFSLDAANPVAVELARDGFHLPYYTAAMTCERQGQRIRYASVRTHRHAAAATFQGDYHPIGPVFHAAAGSVEHWLTARYCLYAANRRGDVWRGDIHHVPWPLQPAEAELR